MQERKPELILPSKPLKNVSDFLTDKEVALLSATSKVHQQEMVKAEYWESRIIALGYKNNVLHQVVKSGVIQNYKKLYYAVLRTNKNIKTIPVKITFPWEFYCLSGEVAAIQYAKQAGLTAATQSADGLTILHFVAWSGSREAIEYVLSIQRINPLARDNTGRTALHYAALSGSREAIERVLQIPGLNPLAQNLGRAVLHMAAWSGSREAIERVLQISDLNPLACDHLGRTALHFAALGGSREALERVLQIPGINPLAQDLGRAVLHYAAWSGSREAIERVLQIPDFKPLAEDHLARTVLHFAAWSGSREAIERVLQIRGLNPLAQDNAGRTALHYAALSGSREAIECVLQIPGLNPGVRDADGRTALHYAAWGGSVPAIFFLHSLPYGFNPRTPDHQRRDAFYYAEQSHSQPGAKKIQEIKRALALVEADINRYPEKICKTIGSLSLGAAMGYGLVKTGVIIATTSTFLLMVCCISAVGVLLIALMINCLKNHRYGFFEPARESDPRVIEMKMQRRFNR
jgi:ankyrin repeat protein